MKILPISKFILLSTEKMLGNEIYYFNFIQCQRNKIRGLKLIYFKVIIRSFC